MSFYVGFTALVCLGVQTQEDINLSWRIAPDEYVSYSIYDTSGPKPQVVDEPPLMLFGYEQLSANPSWFTSGPRELCEFIALSLPGKSMKVGARWGIETRVYYPPPMGEDEWWVKAIELSGSFRFTGVDEKRVASLVGTTLMFRLRFLSGNWVREIKPSATLETALEFDPALGLVVRSHYRLTGSISEMGQMRDKGLSRNPKVHVQRLLEVKDKATKISPTALVESINSAIKRGSQWLLRQQRTDGSIWDSIVEYPAGQTAIVAAALHHSGVSPGDTAVSRAVAFVVRRNPVQVYEMSTALSALETKYLPLDKMVDREQFSEKVGRKQVQTQITQEDKAIVNRLADALVSFQEKTGTWGYPANGQRFDHSNTQYALMGLKSASRCGYRIPPSVWKSAARHFVSMKNVGNQPVQLQIEPFKRGGLDWSDAAPVTVPASWGYFITKKGLPGEYDGSGSMTCAALTSLIICMSELELAGELDAKLQAEIEEAIRQGLAWLQANWTIRTVAPGGGIWVVYHYYTLYSIERVGLLLGMKTLGGHDWFLEGAAWLVNAQRADGSWASYGSMPIVDTAFALLFLKKAVVPVETPSRKK